MDVVVTGGTGFIGRKLVGALRSRGDRVTVLSRDPQKASQVFGPEVRCCAWNPEASELDSEAKEALAQARAVVNLAGENVMAKRWNAAFKERVRASRVLGTRLVVDAMLRGEREGRVLVNSSGSDFYGDTGEEECEETHAPGTSYLARVCVDWEAEAERAGREGIRNVQLRTGLVLGEHGGALERMLLPFKLFVGGYPGNGRQWWGWIAMDDMLGAILFAIDTPSLRGGVNTVSPQLVRAKDLCTELGRVLHRPSWAPVPYFALRAAFGEAAGLLVESKRTPPKALLNAGYKFLRPDLGIALEAVLDPNTIAA